MSLHEVCKSGKPYSETSMYSLYRTTVNGVNRSVFCYQIPFPPEREADLMVRYGLSADQRRKFYEDFLKALQHEIEVTDFLSRNGVPSLLVFLNMETMQENETTYLYLETEYVEPLLQTELKTEISPITLIDITSRIAMILRDINAKGVVHRGVDLREVFVNQEKKYLLSGFLYSFCESVNVSPFGSYLPNHPENISEKFLQGQVGSIGLDIQSLAKMIWNIFSGNAYDYPLKLNRKVFPEYADEDIVAALSVGLTGNDSNCNLFRRKLVDCRKALIKAESEGNKLQMIPIRQIKYKDYKISYVP